MKIRLATEDDIPELLGPYWELVELHDDPEDWTDAKIQAVLEDSLVIVAEQDDRRLVAFVAFLLFPDAWFKDKVLAYEQGIWVEHGTEQGCCLRLVRFATRHLRNIGVKRIMGRARRTTPKSVLKLYRRLGMKETDTTYIGEL